MYTGDLEIWRSSTVEYSELLVDGIDGFDCKGLCYSFHSRDQNALVANGHANSLTISRPAVSFPQKQPQ